MLSIDPQSVQPQIGFAEDLRNLLDWQKELGLEGQRPLLVIDERDCDTEDKGHCPTATSK